MKDSIIYIGDFDLRNNNVQAYLVRNNAKILSKIGYRVCFIGVNRKAKSDEIASFPQLSLGDENDYLELENTLSVRGLLRYTRTAKQILSYMDRISNVKFVISYQSPSFAPVLKRIAIWCKNNEVKYIVNCADITLFDSQPFLRRLVMTLNWKYLHSVNKKYSDGLIAVSRTIERFYRKKGMPSVIIPPLFDDYLDGEYDLSDKVTFIYAGSPFVLKKKVKPIGMKDRLDKIIDLCIQLSAEKTMYHLIIIGITKEMYTMCVPRHKDVLDKNTDISFMGRYSHNDTLKAVRNADYMLNLRDANIMNEAGLSTKVVESVSLGTPVVMNDIGDTFLYLKKGITGFVLSGDSKKDVALLTSLCSKTFDERINQKNNCAGDKTFALTHYEDLLGSFLKEVKGN